MAFKQMNLKTKTIVSGSPDDQDKAVEAFQKTHNVQFGQARPVFDAAVGKIRYIMVLFYE